MIQAFRDFIVKPCNAYKARAATREEEEESGPTEIELLTEIRDALASGSR